MGRYVVYVLGLVLMFAPRSRADVTLTNGTAEGFASAISKVIASGGGTILVTRPITIGTTNGDFVDELFDGESLVTVSGGNTNPVFTVLSGSVTLANMTVKDGIDLVGGGLFVASDATVTLTNCIFSNNRAVGFDGESAETSTNSGNGVIGKNGGRGSPGESAYGGAIFNRGSLAVFACKFITNSVIGGDGGIGGDGEDAGTRGGNGGSGGAGGHAAGGGIFNIGSIVVSNSTFSGNLVRSGSGGIGGNAGIAIISGVNGFAGAAGTAAGAGICTFDTNTSLILNSTFDHNTAHGGDSPEGGTSIGGVGQNGPRGGDALGGGIENSGVLFIMNSSFFQNNALGGTGGNGGVGGARGGNGGAGGKAIGGNLYNAGYIGVQNSTLSKGNARGGTNGSPGSGAVSGQGGKTGSSFGGNIANVAKKKHGVFQLQNSIIGTNLSGGGGYGTITDLGFNLSADKSIKFKKSSTSKPNTNPLVGDLADNGGPTETMALATNSPAVDKLDPASAPDIDQRGVTRPQGPSGLSDIGAYELDVDSAKILLQPQSVSTIVGSNVTFSVTAGGTGPLFYQWLFNSAPIAGATTNSLALTNVQLTNSGNFQVIVSNSFNAVTSHVAALTVKEFTNSPPVITQQPTNRQEVLTGTSVGISVIATSATPLFYQWKFKDSTLHTFTLVGATNNLISIPNAQPTNSGTYQVVITNIAGAVTSSVSDLLVTNAPSGGGISPP
jgi:hypothetical protein